MSDFKNLKSDCFSAPVICQRQRSVYISHIF